MKMNMILNFLVYKHKNLNHNNFSFVLIVLIEEMLQNIEHKHCNIYYLFIYLIYFLFKI